MKQDNLGIRDFFEFGCRAKTTDVEHSEGPKSLPVDAGKVDTCEDEALKPRSEKNN